MKNRRVYKIEDCSINSYKNDFLETELSIASSTFSFRNNGKVLIINDGRNTFEISSSGQCLRFKNEIGYPFQSLKDIYDYLVSKRLECQNKSYASIFNLLNSNNPNTGTDGNGETNGNTSTQNNVTIFHYNQGGISIAHTENYTIEQNLSMNFDISNYPNNFQYFWFYADNVNTFCCHIDVEVLNKAGEVISAFSMKQGDVISNLGANATEIKLNNNCEEDASFAWAISNLPINHYDLSL